MKIADPSAATADARVSATAVKLACLSIALFLLYAIDATWHLRGFFADGAYFYYDVLNQKAALNFSDDSKHIRLLINVVNQLPLVVLTKLGVMDPLWLRLAFNAPLFFGNVLVLALLWGLAWRHQTYRVACFASVAFVATILPSDLFAINQARLAQGFYWVILFFTLTPKPIHWLEKILLLVCVAISFRSHEAIIFFGPIIALAAWLSHQQYATNRATRKMLMFAGVALMLFGLYWQMTHPVKSGTMTFFASIFSWRLSDVVFSPIFFSWSLMALLGAQFWLTRQASPAWPVLQRWSTWVYFPVCLLVGLTPVLQPQLLWPLGEYGFRVFIPFGGAGLACLAIADGRWGFTSKLNKSTTLIWISAALAGLSVWQISSTRHWSLLVHHVNEATAQPIAPVVGWENMVQPYQSDTAVAWPRYQWYWAFPALSLALSDRRQITALITHEEAKAHLYVDQKTGILHIPFKPVTGRYFDATPMVKMCGTLSNLPVGFCR